ncbi:MAG: nicotinamide riboside transporter PnuC [Bacteroidaceae bacterium]|nr:nicotinamide riboside transporter PnuC [Bacteroidaceae bacterium]
MQAFIDFLSAHQLRLLDIIGAVLGLVYILLEYKANIWFWIVSLIMPLVDMALYFKAGLFADFGMAVYYAVASVCGFIYWKTGSIFGNRKKKNVEISHFPVKTILPCVLVFLVLWLGLYLFLSYATTSTVPVRDSFTTALSIVALWALTNKYIEQWLLWLVVDIVSCQLYIHKGIPFKAILYGIYVVIAVFGYRKWLLMYGK